MAKLVSVLVGRRYLLSSREMNLHLTTTRALKTDSSTGNFKRCGGAPLTANRRCKEIVVFTQPDEYRFLFKALIEEYAYILRE